MKRIVTGILAHVDAGKTTCIESMLYNAGKLRMMGRVDHKDAYLDYDSQERDRGITIYSKEANYTWKDAEIYLIDTPGHVDFSSEMERSLQILDLAILLINGMDGVQSHTETIWKCLQHYHVPTLIFINKMDITYMEKEQLLHDLQTKCSSNCIAFNQSDTMEQLALVNESMLNQFMETGDISLSMIQQAVLKRECFPCFFGSALKNTGITDLMDAIVTCSFQREYPKEFAARAYKISTDDQGNRLTHMKITGGSLTAKQKINEEEKVDQIWIYNGPDRQAVQQVQAGMVCAVKGLHSIQAGQPLGVETDTTKPVLSACLSYQLLLPEGVDALEMMQTCRQLAAEDPQLQIEFDDQSKKIHIQLMGAIQMEVLQNQIYQRSKVHVGFQSGQVIYRETIAKPVLGIGHFEPLRHYAEVLLHLEPLPTGSGLVFESHCSQDQLAVNWQRLILTHLQERTHKGVLTGSPITDMKITLLAGIAHVKHTEGGDFRQATYRAVRQGLKKAESVLLEPYYSFKIQVPQDSLSRTLYDLDCRHASVQIEQNDHDYVEITGKGPVRLMANYQKELISFTRGLGKYSCAVDGYYPCADQDEIVRLIGYDSEHDLRNPTGSVFCSHGSRFYVPYDQVEDYMHIQWKQSKEPSSLSSRKYTVQEEEMKRIFQNAGGRNRNEKKVTPKPKKKIDMEPQSVQIQAPKPNCLIVDGYNMLYSWTSFQESVRTSFSSARDQLIDMIINYQGYKGYVLYLVFDAYRVKDNAGKTYRRGNTNIIYTKTNQTADDYIERLVHDLKKKYRLIVATSDGLIQNTVLANGGQRMSSRELENAVRNVNSLALSHGKKGGSF